MAEEIGKKEIATLVREHELDGAAVQDIAEDDEVLSELTGGSKLKTKLLKTAIKQLQDATAQAAPQPSAPVAVVETVRWEKGVWFMVRREYILSLSEGQLLLEETNYILIGGLV